MCKVIIYCSRNLPSNFRENWADGETWTMIVIAGKGVGKRPSNAPAEPYYPGVSQLLWFYFLKLHPASASIKGKETADILRYLNTLFSF